MKKLFYILALCLGLAGTASASSFTVEAGATTNKVQHGQTISARGASAGLTATGKTDIGIFGQYGVDTVAIANSGANLQHTVAVGFEKSLFDDAVATRVGYREHMYTGGGTAVAANSLNYGEVFVGASAYGVSAEVRKEQKLSKDLGVELGYKHQFAENCAGRVGYEYINYGLTQATYHGYRVGADYAITKSLKASADYIHTGKNSADVKLPNQVAVSVAYLF